MDSILNQLIEYYYSDQCKDKNQEPSDVRKYFEKLLEDKNIVYKTDEAGKLIALMEFWMITTEQADRLVRGGKVFPRDEDVLTGDICYINDFWINPEFRDRGRISTFTELRQMAEKLHNRKATAIMLKEYKYKKRFRVFKGGG